MLAVTVKNLGNHVVRGVVLKKKWGTPETGLRQRFLNNLGHTRTLIHVRKILLY